MKRVAVIFLPVMLFSLQSYAFTLEEAIHTALTQRGDITVAENNFESAEWSRNSAHTWMLPQVDFSLTYQQSHDIQEMVIPGLGSIALSSEWSSLYGVTASLPLVLQGPLGAEMASTALNLSENSLIGAKQDAISNVVSSFYGVLMAEMMAEVTTEAITIAREGYVLAEQRFNAGTISRFELLQSQVAYENRRPDSIAALTGAENARAAFSVSLGFTEDHVVSVEGALTDPFPVVLPETIEEARSIMESSSIELNTAKVMRDMSDAQVNLAGAAFAPQLVFQTSYGFQASVDDISEISGEDYSRNWTTSATLQVPIFHGISDYSGYQSARAERRASFAQAQDLENYSYLSLTAAWNSLNQAKETVFAAKSTVGQAEEASEIATISYEAGMITRLDMDGAFLALTQARTNYASALYSLKTAEVALARILGILDTSIEEMNK